MLAIKAKEGDVDWVVIFHSLATIDYHLPFPGFFCRKNHMRAIGAKDGTAEFIVCYMRSLPEAQSTKYDRHLAATPGPIPFGPG